MGCVSADVNTARDMQSKSGSSSSLLQERLGKLFKLGMNAEKERGGLDQAALLLAAIGPHHCSSQAEGTIRRSNAPTRRSE